MATNDIEFYRGNNVTITCTIAGQGSISGYEFWLAVKETWSDTDEQAKVLKRTSGLWLEGDDTEAKITDASGRVVEFYILPADTKDLDPKEYYYDIQWLDTSSKVKTVARAMANIKFRVVYAVA